MTFPHVDSLNQACLKLNKLNQCRYFIKKKELAEKMATKSVMLTEKQKNHSLSGKKKKSKKSVRYSLAQPFPRYWYVF